MNRVPYSRRPGGTSVVVLLLLAGWLFGGAAAHAQFGRWQAHTSLRQVAALSASDDAVWAATLGGLFSFTPATGELQAFTASDGLHGVQTRAVAYDARRRAVWIGYQDGVIDRLSLETGVVRSFRDIARAERFTSRAINRLVLHGDSLLVATAFGLVVFDPVRGEVRDTYSQLGGFTSAIGVRDVVVAPTPEGTPGFWLATEEGVAYASLQTPNLQDPAVWQTEQQGLAGSPVYALAAFQGTVYAGTARGLSVREADGRYRNLGITTWPVTDLAPVDGRLIGVERFNLVAVEADGQVRMLTFAAYQDPTAVVEGPDGGLWFGDLQGGLVAADVPAHPATELSVETGRYPDGPFHSLFSDLMTDADGHLWAAGMPEAGTGFYKLAADGQWVNYVPALVPELQGMGTFDRLYRDAQGHLWAGAVGTGLLQLTPEAGDFHLYDRQNSSLQGAKGTTNPNYILVGGIAGEQDGTLWVTNRAAPAALHARTPGGDWIPVPAITCGGFPSGVTLDRILIDSFGQKWIVAVDESNLRRVLGLLVLDTGRAAAETGDDRCHYFSQEGSGGQGLPSTRVTAVVEGRDGLVWIGTERGLAFIINSGIVAADEQATPIWPQLADRTQGLFLFNGIKINDLAVDPANRLWVATDEGVSLVQQAEGGYEIVQRFTTDNAPLFSNVVMAVAVDARSGRVYFATDRGLVSYQGDAVAPVEQARDLLVYPNPVRVTDGAEPAVFIEGLVEATELRVLAPHGEVVARLATRGGRARWDGRDLQNRLVPSGVYLVVAVGQNGEGTAYGKVAVIR